MMEKIMNYIAGRMFTRAQKRAAWVREVQSQYGRDQERVIRLKVFQGSILLRSQIKQDVFEFTARVRKDGVLEQLNNSKVPDITIYTDFPTLNAIGWGQWSEKRPDGSTYTEYGFDIKRAWAIGHIEWEPEGETMLPDLVLVQKIILPVVQEELRSVWKTIFPRNSSNPTAPSPPRP